MRLRLTFIPSYSQLSKRLTQQRISPEASLNGLGEGWSNTSYQTTGTSLTPFGLIPPTPYPDIA